MLDLLRHRRAFAGRLLRWYRANRRDLPWRRSLTPYRVLVSEVMLQQTRAETAIPYYRRFLCRFPDLRALARAQESEVLAAWEGLGYYGRARNLLRAARRVCANSGGALPSSARELRRLPGIGPYTAAAVASIAFGAPEPVLDGNVERVTARLLALERPRERRVLRSLLRALLPARDAGDFNQALMELGATVCTPRRPACGRCPVREFCRARASGSPESFPRRRARSAPPVREEAALVVRSSGRVLLRRRPERGLLGGMWAVPSLPVGRTPDAAVRYLARRSREVGRDGAPGRSSEGRDATGARFRLREVLARFRRETGLSVRCEAELPVVRHAYSHFKVVVTPLLCSPGAKTIAPSPRGRRGAPPCSLRPAHWVRADGSSRPSAPASAPGTGLRWVENDAIASLPMGKVDRVILAAAAAHGATRL